MAVNHFKEFSTQADYEAYIQPDDYAKPLVALIDATGTVEFPQGGGGGGGGTGNPILTSVDVADFTDTTFYVGTAVTNVNIPSRVTTIGTSAFDKCTSLTSVTVPDGVTFIDNNAFSNCSALTEASIGAGILTIGHNVFNGCGSLESVTILATTPPTIGTNFVPQTTLNIYVPAASVETYKTTGGWSHYASKIQAIPSA